MNTDGKDNADTLIDYDFTALSLLTLGNDMHWLEPDPKTSLALASLTSDQLRATSASRYSTH